MDAPLPPIISPRSHIEETSTGNVSRTPAIVATLGLGLAIAADLLPFIHQGGYSPRVLSLGGVPLPAIVTRFLAPTAILAFIALGAWLTTRRDRLVRGVASGLLLAAGIAIFFEFIYYSTIVAVIPVPPDIDFSAWTVLGLLGGILAIGAGVACLIGARSRPGSLGEGSLEVRDEVVGVLDADAQPDQVGGDFEG